jgi:hypothetical protein
VSVLSYLSLVHNLEAHLSFVQKYLVNSQASLSASSHMAQKCNTILVGGLDSDSHKEPVVYRTS